MNEKNKRFEKIHRIPAVTVFGLVLITALFIIALFIIGLSVKTATVLIPVLAASLGIVIAILSEFSTSKRRLELSQERIREYEIRAQKQPEKTKAINDAQVRGARLLIAKLDRLARNVAFTSALMESGIDFVAVDMPDANKLTIHILAAIAEYEGELISTRTTAALQSAKDKGVKLGTPGNLTRSAQLKGADSNKQAAIEAYNKVVGYIMVLREKGVSYNRIAQRLNEEGHRTRSSKLFNQTTIYRIVKRQGS